MRRNYGNHARSTVSCTVEGRWRGVSLRLSGTSSKKFADVFSLLPAHLTPLPQHLVSIVDLASGIHGMRRAAF